MHYATLDGARVAVVLREIDDDSIVFDLVEDDSFVARTVRVGISFGQPRFSGMTSDCVATGDDHLDAELFRLAHEELVRLDAFARRARRIADGSVSNWHYYGNGGL